MARSRPYATYGHHGARLRRVLTDGDRWAMSIDKRCLSRVVSVVATAAVVVGMTASAGMAKPKPRVTKPTLTANVPARTNATSATFTFSSPDATKYTCALDGKKSACTSPKSYIGLGEAALNFSVVGTRTGARASAAATFAWTVDRTPPPAVTFNGVPTGPVAVAGAPDITFNAGEVGDTFSCRVDGGTAFACLANTAGSTQTAGATSNGIHTLSVLPTDAAGNVGPAASVGWEIDDVGPTVTISDPPADPNPYVQQTVHVTVVGAEGNDPVTCTLNDTVTTTPLDCTALDNGVNPLLVATPNDRLYTLTVTATDSVGNSGFAQVHWTHTTGAAEPPVLSGPAAYINNPAAAAAQISWPLSGNDLYSCKVDANAAAACTTPFTPTGVGTDGPHTVAVADTSSGSSASTWSWTLDTVDPTLTVTGGPGAATNADSVTFGIAADADTGAPLDSITCHFTKGATTIWDDT